jgi:hypothetical protein
MWQKWSMFVELLMYCLESEGIGDTIAKGEASPTATLSASWGLGTLRLRSVQVGDCGHFGYAQCKLGIGDTSTTLSASWGLGIVDCGLGIGD